MFIRDSSNSKSAVALIILINAAGELLMIIIFLMLGLFRYKFKKVYESIQSNIIIYHDFLPPSRRSSYVKSDYKRAATRIQPLIHSRGTCALRSCSCAVSTVYRNQAMRPRQYYSPIHMHQGFPLLPILCTLSRCLHRRPSAIQGNFHTIHDPSHSSTQLLTLNDPN